MITRLKVLLAAIGLLNMRGSIRGDFKVLGRVHEDGVHFVDLPRNKETETRATLSLFWDSRKGHAIVQAEPSVIDGESIRFRVIKQLLGNLPTPGDLVWLSGWLGEGPSDFGLENSYNDIKMPNGTKAWLFPQNTKKWVIHVHGRRATMVETLRNVDQFRKLGYNQLTISMETDASPWGLETKASQLGEIEWTQIESAVKYVNFQGAAEILIVAWSQGAFISGQFMQKSIHAKDVNGLIFDSPLLDYRTTMRFQAQKLGYPSHLGDRVIEAIQESNALRFLGYKNVDVDAMSLLMNRLPEIPVLVLYSPSDGYISINDVYKFAIINSSVFLGKITNARHCRLYNEDREQYQKYISDWLVTNRI